MIESVLSGNTLYCGFQCCGLWSKIQFKFEMSFVE